MVNGIRPLPGVSLGGEGSSTINRNGLVHSAVTNRSQVLSDH